MSLKKLLLPAAVLIAVMSFLASHAQAQTMGEYATTTAGVGTGGGSMGTSFSPPSFGESPQTWGVSGTGGSWADRAGAADKDFAAIGRDDAAAAADRDSMRILVNLDDKSEDAECVGHVAGVVAQQHRIDDRASLRHCGEDHRAIGDALGAGYNDPCVERPGYRYDFDFRDDFEFRCVHGRAVFI